MNRSIAVETSNTIRVDPYEDLTRSPVHDLQASEPGEASLAASSDEILNLGVQSAPTSIPLEHEGLIESSENNPTIDIGTTVGMIDLSLSISNSGVTRLTCVTRGMEVLLKQNRLLKLALH